MNGRAILILDALIFSFWALAVGVGSWALFYLGFMLVPVIVWMEGGLRFARARRWSVEFAKTVGQLAHLRRPSNAALRHLGIAFGIIVVIVILNQLRLKMPGDGHGLSVPTNGLTMDFSFSTAGGALVSAFWIAIILLLLGSIFWRLWAPVGLTRSAWRSRTFLVLASLFVLLPGIYSLAMLVGPEDPKQNVLYATILMKTLLSLLVVAFTTMVALPIVGAARPGIYPDVRPVVVPPRV